MKTHGWSRPDTSATSTGDGDNWQVGAPCTTSDAEVWFPSAENQTTFRAQALCRTCPVIARCRIEVDLYERGQIDRNGIFGVWAGETPEQRRERRRAAA